MKANPENRIFKGLDLVVDFATLGEYRVVTDSPRRSVAKQDIWADEIEWTTGPRRRETSCSLPRARDRKLARAVVNG